MASEKIPGVEITVLVNSTAQSSMVEEFSAISFLNASLDDLISANLSSFQCGSPTTRSAQVELNATIIGKVTTIISQRIIYSYLMCHFYI